MAIDGRTFAWNIYAVDKWSCSHAVCGTMTMLKFVYHIKIGGNMRKYTILCYSEFELDLRHKDDTKSLHSIKWLDNDILKTNNLLPSHHR